MIILTTRVFMKKLLNKILPESIVKFLIKQKYKQYNVQTHQLNIEEKHIVKLECSNQKRYNILKSMLYRSFGGLIKVDKYVFYFHPIAIIQTPENIDEYLKHIGAKSRNMNKKALKNGISTALFQWNDRLEDIYAINTSSKQRQGREMDKAYIEYPKKVETIKEKDFSIVYVGAFKDDTLVGYVELYVYGNFIMTNRILGHKEQLKYGVMNILIKHCVEYAIENNVAYINYLTMQNRKNNSLSAFKYRVGFREYSLMEL